MRNETVTLFHFGRNSRLGTAQTSKILCIVDYYTQNRINKPFVFNTAQLDRPAFELAGADVTGE